MKQWSIQYLDVGGIKQHEKRKTYDFSLSEIVSYVSGLKSAGCTEIEIKVLIENVTRSY